MLFADSLMLQALFWFARLADAPGYPQLDCLFLDACALYRQSLKAKGPGLSDLKRRADKASATWSRVQSEATLDATHLLYRQSATTLDTPKQPKAFETRSFLPRACWLALRLSCRYRSSHLTHRTAVVGVERLRQGCSQGLPCDFGTDPFAGFGAQSAVPPKRAEARHRSPQCR